MDFGPLKLGLELGSEGVKGSSSQQGLSSTKKNLSQEAVNKLIYDVMSSDAGLASLATGENMGGGYASSTKSLVAQDFVTKLIGELASVTAETVTSSAQTGKSSSSKKSSGIKTVICTELHAQGLLPSELYNHSAAREHYFKISPLVISGYHLWAIPMVERMKTSSRLCKFFLPFARGRYEMVTTGKFNILGAATIYLGHPICYILGTVVNLGVKYGHVAK